MEEVIIEKLVHGGQGLGTLADGRRVFVWNALPGETVRITIIKKKRSYVEAIANEIIVASPERVEPLEENYLATSPWQMMNFAAENTYKKTIVQDLFAREQVALPTFDSVVTDDLQLHYRNKMEYSFWGNEDGLHLAMYRRGTHGKQIITGSKLALASIDVAAAAVLAELRKLDVRAGDLKSVIVRTQQDGQAVACLFVKSKSFPLMARPPEVAGLKVYYSNPKSPASVPTKMLYDLGETGMSDIVLGKKLSYAVDGFFQVNVPVFEKAVQRIVTFLGSSPLIDMYGGVGSIGIATGSSLTHIVEIDPSCVAMARENIANNKLEAEVVETSSEAALEYITSETNTIIDPPRAGLHPKVTERLRSHGPQKVAYLSCNPATHARDLKLLEAEYSVELFEVYNFFPRTPHIETLALLQRRA